MATTHFWRNKQNSSACYSSAFSNVVQSCPSSQNEPPCRHAASPHTTPLPACGALCNRLLVLLVSGSSASYNPPTEHMWSWYLYIRRPSSQTPLKTVAPTLANE